MLDLLDRRWQRLLSRQVGTTNQRVGCVRKRQFFPLGKGRLVDIPNSIKMQSANNAGLERNTRGHVAHVDRLANELVDLAPEIGTAVGRHAQQEGHVIAGHQ